MLAASRRARGEGSRASSAKAMGIACAEATDVPTCSTRHSRDEDAGLATSCIALRVAATTSGSGVHAPRSGRESTYVSAFHSRAVMSEADGVSQSIPMDTAAATRAADWKPWRVACVT